MKIVKNNLGLTVITGFSLFPVLLWLVAPTALPRFGSLINLFTSIGQITGLIGVCLLSINFILSTRLSFIDKFFNGLNNTYKRHDQTGQLALILLLFHPLFLIPKYAGDVSGAARFLLLNSDWSINFGIIALWLMVILIILTLYFRPKYNIWKWTHKFLGAALLLVALHVWLIPSDTTAFLPLRIYILAMIGLGLLSFIYRTLLGSLLVKKYLYVVLSVLKLNDEVTEIKLKPRGEKIRFVPGQFAFISFKKSDAVSAELHPFSLSSSPGTDYITITIKMLGDYTRKIDSITPGTEAELEAPFGTFSYIYASKKHQVWIAGGIGITPFMSMARSLSRGTSYKIDLFYCTRNKKEAVYLNELKQISRFLNGTLKIIPFYSDERGLVSVEAMKAILNDVMDREVFICAPPLMIVSLKEQFRADGMDARNIHSEEFNF